MNCKLTDKDAEITRLKKIIEEMRAMPSGTSIRINSFDKKSHDLLGERKIDLTWGHEYDAAEKVDKLLTELAGKTTEGKQ